MEDRLRQDILDEAAQFDDQILVADEDDSFNVFDMMLRVSEADVQTPKSMFVELKGEGYNVVYTRIPITDEKVPPLTLSQEPAIWISTPGNCSGHVLLPCVFLPDTAAAPRQPLPADASGHALQSAAVRVCRPQSRRTLTTCCSRCTRPASRQHSCSTARWAVAAPPRAWSSPPCAFCSCMASSTGPSPSRPPATEHPPRQ